MRLSISNAIQVGTSVMFSQNKADMGTIMRGQDRLASGCNPKRIQAVTDIGNRIACKGTLCCGTLQRFDGALQVRVASGLSGIARRLPLQWILAEPLNSVNLCDNLRV